MGISSAGIGSGLDVNSIVTQLVAIERRPIYALKTEVNKLQTQISAFGQIQGKLATLRDAAVKLGAADNWRTTRASSSNAAGVGAVSSGQAQAGQYSVAVERLALGQTLVSRGYADAAAAVGSGTLRIELGDFDAVPPVPKAGAAAIDIAIEPGSDSLTAIRDKINAAGAGVVASIVTDVSGARLVLRSAETGLANGFRVEVTADGDGNPGDTAGLSALAFDPRQAVAPGGTSRPQSAGNAVATVNGVPIESATNVLSGAVEGVTLTLRAPGDAEVTVEPDTDALKKSVDAFVAAFNESIQLLREQTRYDPDNKSAGALQGDRGAVQLLGQLRGLFAGSSGAGGAYSRLSDIGLTLSTDGTVVVDAAKLDQALANGAELNKLFAHGDLVAPANNGIGKQFSAWLDGALGSDGSFETRQQSLKDRVKSREDQEQRLEDRVLRTEARLRAQYTALDTKMGQLSALSSYVTQQMTMLNKASVDSR